jgi:hypothetical protein
MAKTSEAAWNAMLDALSTALGGGYFEGRTGTPPTSVEDTATGTIIFTVTLETPAFATASGGSAALDTPAPVTCDNDADVNNITWGRFYTSADAAMHDVTITISGGGGDMIATKVDPLTGESVAITYTLNTSET